MQELKEALFGSDVVVTPGLVLQELLQGFSGAKAQTQIIERFAALPLLQPDRHDHIGAAVLRNACRQAGVQIGIIDSLLARLAIRHDLTPLTTYKRFHAAANHCVLRVWPAKGTSEAVMPNPSVERTCPGKPGHASYVKH